MRLLEFVFTAVHASARNADAIRSQRHADIFRTHARKLHLQQPAAAAAIQIHRWLPGGMRVCPSGSGQSSAKLAEERVAHGERLFREGPKHLGTTIGATRVPA